MEEEKKYLSNVIDAIHKQINDCEVALMDIKGEENITKDQITSNFYDMDNEELSRQKVDLDETEKVENILKRKQALLEKQIDKPYFARIDFTPNNEQKQKIYIGLSLVKNGDMPLVYDWRAPISSMYYEFETSKAGYDCEDGTIEGKIDLKRQYIIENQKLKSFIDTKETINDQLLQEVLSKNSSSKMREIVSTIQKDQNKLIRLDENKNILVQGVAGSGKTSIALHRAAYLLYKNKETLKPSDIFILSPTTLFSGYISEVLPELGEEDASGSTFLTIAKNFLNKKIQTRDVLVDEITQQKSKKMLAEIAYKSSFSFLEDLQKFLKTTFSKSFRPHDLIFKTRKSETPSFVFTKEEMTDLYFNTYKNMNIEKRISYMADILIERFNLKKNEFMPIKERFCKFLYSFFPTTDLQEILNLFYLSKGISQNKEDFYRFDDVAPLLLIKDFVFGIKQDFGCKYLIIDEAQDFTPTHFYLFDKLFPCPKLVLGDVNQCIEKHLTSEYLNKLSKFLNAKLFHLNKTYRSTKQISKLCQRIIDLENVELINRDGEDPKIIKSTNQIDEIKSLIRENLSNFKHIAVICKTSFEAKNLFEKLEKDFNPQLLCDNDSQIEKQIIITTPTTSKGIEFDFVIIPNCENSNYSDELDRNLLYISCTRALHKLCIIYTKTLSKFLK